MAQKLNPHGQHCSWADSAMGQLGRSSGDRLARSARTAWGGSGWKTETETSGWWRFQTMEADYAAMTQRWGVDLEGETRDEIGNDSGGRRSGDEALRRRHQHGDEEAKIAGWRHRQSLDEISRCDQEGGGEIGRALDEGCSETRWRWRRRWRWCLGVVFRVDGGERGTIFF